MHMFLEPEELARLTGRKMKSLQIVWLRTSGIPFWVSATGHAVVPRSAIDERNPEPKRKPKWRSASSLEPLLVDLSTAARKSSKERRLK
jgi:hypothetical protein